jgi:ABC-type Fe3+-siderophore transport system permease subunit
MTTAALSAADLRLRRRQVRTIPILIVLLALASILTLGVGAVRMAPHVALPALFGHGSVDHVNVARNYELPRILLAWLVGSGLAVSGAVLQAVIRNPLAAPDIVGVTRGAGLSAVVALLIFPGTTIAYLPLAAFAGGILAMVIVYSLSYRNGISPIRLALVGIAFSALAEAVIHYLLLKNLNTKLGTALIWLVGSLAGRDISQFWQALPWIGVLLPLTVLCARRLDVLGLGDDLAAGLGERVERLRRITLLLAVALASASVAVGGTIGFIGLIAPHIARRLVGPRHARLLPASALIGALLLVAADAVGRGIHPPLELPAGLITAVIGAPYFLYLLMRSL